MKDLILKRDVETASYEALMDIGTPRDEYGFILPVLALSEEGGITEELVNTRLFGVDGNDPRGRRLLEVMVGYRLIRKRSAGEDSAGSHYRLTERALTLKEVLQQEEYDLIDIGFLMELARLNIVTIYIDDPLILFRRINSNSRKISCEGLTPLGEEIFCSNSENLSGIDPGVASELERVGIIESSWDLDKNSSTPQYELTDTGRMALQEGKVLVPQKGVFVLTGTTDPLFPESVVACQPKKDKIKNGREFEKIARSSRNGKNGRAKNKKQEEKQPGWLNGLRKSTPKVLTLAAQNREVIQVVDIDEHANPSSMKQEVSVSLRLSSGSAPEMTVVSSGGNKAAAETRFNLTLMEVLECLFKERKEDVVEYGSNPVLLVSYDEIKNNPSEVNNMQRTTIIHAPEIQGFGRFKDVKINGLPLLPRSLEDAGNWARDRVFEGITTYIDEHSYDTLCEKEATRFSERFEPDQVKSRLPIYQEMRTIMEERRGKDPKKYWFVTAPAVLTFKEGM